MEKQKVKISIIDFMPAYKKLQIGTYSDGTPAYLGDTVKRNDGLYFISYRYGSIMIKQPGTIHSVGSPDFDKGDFSSVEQTTIFGAAQDWLIIGYEDDPIIQEALSLIQVP